MKNITDILNKQRAFFATGATLDIKFHTEMLKKLYKTIAKPKMRSKMLSSQTSEKEVLKDIYAKL